MTDSVGSNEIYYRAYFELYPDVSYYSIEQPIFTVNIQNNFNASKYVVMLAPEWLSELENQSIYIGDSLLYEFADFDEVGEITIKMENSRIRHFSKYSQEQKAFVVNGNLVRESDIGIWNLGIEVTVTYDKSIFGATQKYKSQF